MYECGQKNRYTKNHIMEYKRYADKLRQRENEHIRQYQSNELSFTVNIFCVISNRICMSNIEQFYVSIKM